MKKTRIIGFANDPSVAGGLEAVLRGEGYDADIATDPAASLSHAKSEDFDIFVLDLDSEKGFSKGFDMLKQLRRAHEQVPIIVLHSFAPAMAIIELTKYRPFRRFEKPHMEMANFVEAVAKAVAARSHCFEAKQTIDVSAGLKGIIGNSAVMQGVYEEIGRLADKSISVLIRGETGTGKELVAEALHAHSERVNQPFIAVNLSALPENLVERELFGSEPGAFTDAKMRYIGILEQANGGTVFLDEIDKASLTTQAKVLRTLQDKKIRRLGGKETITVDVRIVAATNRNLEQAVQQGEFRQDLLYRLKVAEIHLPPLRDRREDIPNLVEHFVSLHGLELCSHRPRISEEAMKRLQAQPWFGNVRELENLIRRALLHVNGAGLTAEIINQALAQSGPASNNSDCPCARCVAELLAKAKGGEIRNIHSVIVEKLERELYTQAFNLTGGNQSEIARLLGVCHPTVHKKLIQFGLLEETE